MKTRRVEKIVNYYADVAKKRHSYPILLINQDVAEMENRIFNLLYCYTSYWFYDYSAIKIEFLADLWTALIKFLKIFAFTGHPNTLLWVLETYYLYSQKYLPVDVLTKKTIRGDMHKHMNPVFEHIASVINKQIE